MAMEKTIKSFLQTINERSHVLQLIKNTELLVTFVSMEKSIPIAIKNGKIFLSKDTDSTLINYEISGDIEQLLEGEETLRYLVRKGRLKISAPFRTILLLESMFYLAKANQNLKKII